jgi:hypothetical protein
MTSWISGPDNYVIDGAALNAHVCKTLIMGNTETVKEQGAWNGTVCMQTTYSAADRPGPFMMPIRTVPLRFRQYLIDPIAYCESSTGILYLYAKGSGGYSRSGSDTIWPYDVSFGWTPVGTWSCTGADSEASYLGEKTTTIDSSERLNWLSFEVTEGSSRQAFLQFWWELVPLSGPGYFAGFYAEELVT